MYTYKVNNNIYKAEHVKEFKEPGRTNIVYRITCETKTGANNELKGTVNVIKLLPRDFTIEEFNNINPLQKTLVFHTARQAGLIENEK